MAESAPSGNEGEGIERSEVGDFIGSPRRVKKKSVNRLPHVVRVAGTAKALELRQGNKAESGSGLQEDEGSCRPREEGPENRGVGRWWHGVEVKRVWRAAEARGIQPGLRRRSGRFNSEEAERRMIPLGHSPCFLFEICGQIIFPEGDCAHKVTKDRQDHTKDGRTFNPKRRQDK